ncbi:MAG: GNAT family N-acetyltransferase [Bacteroidota bacterium]
MHIRKATKEDVPKIVALLADDELGKGRERFSIPLPQAYWEAFERIHTDPHQELMVMEDHGKITGTLQLSFISYLTYRGGKRAQIEAVRIHKNHRGKGFGEKLLKWAIHRAKENGAHLVQLTTDKKRQDALQFYQQLGFTASHEGMKLHLLT